MTTSGPFSPVRLGPITLKNRIIKAATFEGVMPKGAVTDKLISFHRKVAAGGAAMTTVAYCSVSESGRVNRNTMVMKPEIAADLRRLTEAVHSEGALACAQIGHAGPVANQVSNGTRSLGPSARFSAPAMGRIRSVDETDMDEIVDQFASAARVAVDAGFDAVEVHLGHNYLLSAFLSPNLNRRRDRHGGSIENRLRFPRRVLESVRTAADDNVAVTAKLNMADGVDGGLWLDESIPMAQTIAADGFLDAIQLSGGSSLLNSMYLFRGEVPMAEMAATQPKLVGFGMKHFAKGLFPEYPFEEAYFLPYARQFRAAVDLPLILLGGINRLDTIETALDDGFEAVAMARALLREPDLPNRFLEASRTESLCVHCNKCMPTIYRGTHCVLVPVEQRW